MGDEVEAGEAEEGDEAEVADDGEDIQLRKHKHINVTRKFRLKDIFYHKHLFSFYQSLPTKISVRLWEKFEIKFQLLNFLYF